MCRSITKKTARPVRIVTVEKMSLPIARPSRGGSAITGRALPATIVTMMSACAAFAVVVSNLPHGSF